jgi:hypothetical protein
MSKFIKLSGYELPAKGEHYKIVPVWVNVELIAHMTTFSAVMFREENGRYAEERIPATSIAFAAAFADEIVGVSVLETPDAIIEAIGKLSVHQ